MNLVIERTFKLLFASCKLQTETSHSG